MPEILFYFILFYFILFLFIYLFILFLKKFIFVSTDPEGDSVIDKEVG